MNASTTTSLTQLRVSQGRHCYAVDCVSIFYCKMAQIRSTIELLATILKENGATKVKAEIFRLAKFNDNSAVSYL